MQEVVTVVLLSEEFFAVVTLIFPLLLLKRLVYQPVSTATVFIPEYIIIQILRCAIIHAVTVLEPP